MKRLLVLSGKGGTGKTTTAAALIYFSKASAFADCDVDAPNLHLVSNTRIDENGKVSDFYGSKKSRIDVEKCVNCGLCLQKCRFQAIQKIGAQYYINEYHCEGCGVCEFICPHGAIVMQDDIAGELTLHNNEVVFSTAKLKMGRGNSGKLVTAVKKQLTDACNEFQIENTMEHEMEFAIIDGSPGIGCPVIASINGVDLVLVVAEPSLSGISDMERIIKTADILQTKVVVCVNKYDTSIENTESIEQICREKSIEYVGRIPYDKQASRAINEGKTLAEITCPASDALYEIYKAIHNILK